MPQLHQQTFDDLPLAHRPRLGLAQECFNNRIGLSQVRAFLQADPIIAEVRAKPILHLGRALDRLFMGMKPVASLLGFEIGNPNRLGRACQVSFGNTHRADPVVIGVGLFEFA